MPGQPQAGPGPGFMAPPPGAPPGAGWGGTPGGAGWGQNGPGPYAAGGASAPWAPYGVHPMTGIPFSDKQKVLAGLLQIFLPFGCGRFYTGHTGLGVAQLCVCFFTCGLGSLWPFFDGIMMLAGNVPDVHGRPLRD